MMFQTKESIVRQRHRLHREPPSPWGEPMVMRDMDTGRVLAGFFCHPCWRRGSQSGFHPWDVAPCVELMQ